MLAAHKGGLFFERSAFGAGKESEVLAHSRSAVFVILTSCSAFTAADFLAGAPKSKQKVRFVARPPQDRGKNPISSGRLPSEGAGWR
jgi:hypothetical protein